MFISAALLWGNGAAARKSKVFVALSLNDQDRQGYLKMQVTENTKQASFRELAQKYFFDACVVRSEAVTITFPNLKTNTMIMVFMALASVSSVDCISCSATPRRLFWGLIIVWQKKDDCRHLWMSSASNPLYSFLVASL